MTDNHLPPLLPTEVFGIIAEHMTDKATLVSLLKASTNLYTEVERVLYKEVLMGRPYRPVAFCNLLEGLLAHPRRALLVRKLRLDFANYIDFAVSSKLASALCEMHSLIHLHLNIFGLTLIKLMEGCSFQLRRLEYSDQIPMTDLSLPQVFKAHPTIRYLRIGTYSLKDPLPADTLPQLTILDCPAYLGRTLMGDRKISRVFWRHTSPEFLTMPPYGPHRALLVLKISVSPIGFDLPAACPNLRFLECYLVVHDNSVPALVDSIKNLCHLHTLRAYSLAIQRFSASPEWVMQKAKTLTDLLFPAIPSLRVIQIRDTERIRGERLKLLTKMPTPWDEWTEEL